MEENGVVSVNSGMSLLIGDALHLCLVQMPERELDAVKEDKSGAVGLSIIEVLLGQDSVLRKKWSGNAPATVLMPEYAFGSGDWAAVDQVVRGFAGPLVLIAGFGVTRGKWFSDWTKGGGANGTKRILAVGRDQEPAEDATYAGGWCWIKDKETTCVSFIKNHLEQDVEYKLVSDCGQSIAQINFKDIVLFPMLCADCLCTQPNPPFARIKSSIKNCRGKVLITASLWQGKPYHSRWQQAFNTLFVDTPEELIVALSNQAVDTLTEDEDRDCWRSLSGIAIPPLHPTTADSDDAVRPVTRNGNKFIAAILRRSDPCITIGKLYWPPYRSSSSRQPWVARTVYPLSLDGRLLTGVPTGLAFYELDRFIKRNPPKQHNKDRLLPGLEKVKSKLPNFPAGTLYNTILFGLDGTAAICPDRLHAHKEHLLEGLFSLAYLLSHPGCDWQEDTGRQGQARFSDKNANVLVWRSNLNRLDLKRRIQTWQIASPGHPPIVILNRCTGRDVEGSVTPEEEAIDGAVQPESRSDVAIPYFDDSQSRSIIAPKYPKVAAKSLGSIIDGYEEHETPDTIICDLKRSI